MPNYELLKALMLPEQISKDKVIDQSLDESPYIRSKEALGRTSRLSPEQFQTEAPISNEIPYAPDELAAAIVAPGVQKYGFKALQSLANEAPGILANEAGVIGSRNASKSLSKILKLAPESELNQVAEHAFQHNAWTPMAGRAHLDDVILNQASSATPGSVISNKLQEAAKEYPKLQFNLNNQKLGKGVSGLYEYSTKNPEAAKISLRSDLDPDSKVYTLIHELLHNKQAQETPEKFLKTIDTLNVTPEKLEVIKDTLKTLDIPQEKKLQALRFLELATKDSAELGERNVALKTRSALQGLNEHVANAEDQIRLLKAFNYGHFPEVTQFHQADELLVPYVKEMSSFTPNEQRLFRVLNSPQINKILKEKLK